MKKDVKRTSEQCFSFQMYCKKYLYTIKSKFVQCSSQIHNRHVVYFAEFVYVAVVSSAAVGYCQIQAAVSRWWWWWW